MACPSSRSARLVRAGAYKFVDALDTLVPNGPPSLIGCSKLTIEGKMVFEAGVVFKGAVKVVNGGDECKTLKAGEYTGDVTL